MLVSTAMGSGMKSYLIMMAVRLLEMRRNSEVDREHLPALRRLRRRTI